MLEAGLRICKTFLASLLPELPVLLSALLHGNIPLNFEDVFCMIKNMTARKVDI